MRSIECPSSAERRYADQERHQPMCDGCWSHRRYVIPGRYSDGHSREREKGSTTAITPEVTPKKPVEIESALSSGLYFYIKGHQAPTIQSVPGSARDTQEPQNAVE